MTTTNLSAMQAEAIRELVRLAQGNDAEAPSAATLDIVAGVLWMLDEFAIDEAREAA